MVTTRPLSKKANICFSLEDSGALIGSNDDLLTEILLRLPATSILRFKSVSKHWLWLLSDRHFTQRYDKLLKTPGIFVRDKYVPFDVENPNPNPPPFRSDYFNDLAVENQSTLPFRGLKFYFDSSDVEILQSCNGLLLCCTDRGRSGRKCADKYYVFNPTTKQLALIPPLPRHMKSTGSKSIGFMALAFHQTDRVHYKVVRVCSLKPRLLYQIQIYSFDTKEWKISIEKFSAPGSSFYGSGIHCNGAVHWNSMSGKLWYFKVDVEQLQTMSLPQGMMFCVMRLVESRGHLHLISFKNSQENGSPLIVYEMLSDHSGWFVKYQLQLDALAGAFPNRLSRFGASYCFGVIDVVRGEEEEDTFLVLKTQSPQKIITYNVHDKSFKEIFSYPRFFRERYLDFHRYTETLSSF